MKMEEFVGQMNTEIMIISLILSLFFIVVYWKIFTKAGKPGWAILIPIYNIIVMLEIVKKPWWWLLLIFIPFVNFIIALLIMVNLIKSFGQPGWHIILALFFSYIYYPYLAFSSAEYNPDFEG
jgi:hypothetical protein